MTEKSYIEKLLMQQRSNNSQLWIQSPWPHEVQMYAAFSLCSNQIKSGIEKYIRTSGRQRWKNWFSLRMGQP
jgi:hypothetical protein